MAAKSPPGQGGWQIFLSWAASASMINPAQTQIRANSEGAFFGWPNSQQVEAEVAAWFEANTFEAEKAAVRRLNKAAFDHVVYAPLGFFLGYQAWRKKRLWDCEGTIPVLLRHLRPPETCWKAYSHPGSIGTSVDGCLCRVGPGESHPSLSQIRT
jgi:hypothetical protein